MAMDQAAHRAFYHFREARIAATGEQVFVDDITFDPVVHEELDAPRKAEAKKAPAPRAEK